MALEKFTFATLQSMDGERIMRAMNRALENARLDCDDRPGLKAKREIVLRVMMEPIAEGKELGSVKVGFEIGTKLPKQKSKEYSMEAARGGLLYNDASPEDVRQKTLDMAGKPSMQTETGSRRDRTGEELNEDVG